MTDLFDAIIAIDNSSAISITNWQIWLIFGLAMAISLSLYLLRSIGIYVLAKRQGIRKAYLAWIPCVWIYVVCKLLGNARFLNQPIRSFAHLMTIAFAIAEVLTFVYNFLQYFPLLEYMLMGGNVYVGKASQFGGELFAYLSVGEGVNVYVTQQLYPLGMSISTVDKVLDGIALASYFFDLASIFIVVSVYFSLFRKYWPQHYMLISLLSIFISFLFPIFVFVIRKKNPIDFNEYMRSRYGAYQNPYGRPYNPYSNQYGNPYGAQGGQGAPRPQQPESPFEDFEDKKNKKPKDPFEEFSGKPKDPFEEFDNKN